MKVKPGFVMFVLVLSAALSGCALWDDLVHKQEEFVELKTLLSPKSKEQIKNDALSDTAATLALIPTPNVAAAVFLPEVENVLGEQLKSAGVTKLEVSGDE